jgi:hypothetical protein
MVGLLVCKIIEKKNRENRQNILSFTSFVMGRGFVAMVVTRREAFAAIAVTLVITLSLEWY